MFDVHLTTDQRRNLDTLATYLENLPEDYTDFNMNYYFFEAGRSEEDAFIDSHTSEFAKIEAKYARENGGVGKCGAVACAVGHGPSAGILFDEFDFAHNNPEKPEWGIYVEKFCTNGSLEWEFMFSGVWSLYDNTPHGAAKRIRYLLAHYQLPDLYVPYDSIKEKYEAFHAMSRTS